MKEEEPLDTDLRVMRSSVATRAVKLSQHGANRAQLSMRSQSCKREGEDVAHEHFIEVRGLEKGGDISKAERECGDRT